MTLTAFKKLKSKHKIVKMSNVSLWGFVLKFDNGESVTVHCGYEGLTFSHSLEPKSSSKKLMKDLQELAPTMLNDIQKKYAESGDLYFASKLINTEQ